MERRLPAPAFEDSVNDGFLQGPHLFLGDGIVIGVPQQVKGPVNSQANDLLVESRAEPAGVRAGLVHGDKQIPKGFPSPGPQGKPAGNPVTAVAESDDVREPVFPPKPSVHAPQVGPRRPNNS